MLPAGLRGFASRVGRLALRAFAWNKGGAVARPARTLLRALFAMLVVAATLLATFVVPAQKASAGQVYWDKFGNAVVAADHSNLGSAFVNMKTGDCTKYELDKGTCKDEYYPLVEPGKGTDGRTKITFRGVFNPLLDKNRFNTRPVFYLITPRGLVDDTIRITREVKWISIARENNNGKIVLVHKPQDNWDNKSNGSETVGQFYNPGKQRYTYLPSDGDKYNHFWDITLGDKGCGSNRTSMCELYAWKNRGEIGRIFQSWEKEKEAVYRWTVTADVDPRYDPYQLFFAMGYTDDMNENVENASSVRHYTVSGPYDTDGDGIPDFEEYNIGDRPDHGVDQTTKGGMKYDEVKNVEPFSSFESKNYFETGTWDGDTVNGHFVKDGGKTYKLPTKAGLVYSFEGEPTDEKGNKVKVTYDDNYGTAHTLSPGHAWLDPLTGHVSFNPGPEHKRHTITFHVQVKYPDPSLYNCKRSPNDRLIEHLQAKFKVEPMSRFYYPEWDNTTVTAGSSKQSTEPHSKKDDRRGTKYAKKLPAKSFTLNKYGKWGQDPLKWSSLTNGGDKTGKVTFSPEKPMDAGDYKTPVVVTYLDGSTSADPDSGNGGNPVYAPVKVEDLTVTSNPQDLNLKLLNGKSINNNAFGGDINYHNASSQKPRELTKGQSIGKGAKDDGIVLDSWSTNAKGPITFRAVCHKKDDPKAPYTLLKPAEGKNKASGDVDGLQFQDFRQWIRDNDPKCANGNCTDGNQYLSKGEWNSSTMERSRALIGGTPKKAGEYECKVFAFHEAHTGAGKQYNDALKTFDGLVKQGANYGFAFDIGNTFASTRGTEWTVDSFHFKIKLNDNQKYNPTYVKTGTIEAGKFKIGDFVDSNGNSSKQPTSIKNGNGVPTKDQDDIVVDRLPKGTWFEIKRLIKSADKDNNKAKTYPWANLEGDEDNVKRDDKGNPVKKDNKIQPNDTTSIREYGAVTFRPDKWQDAGEYWAEVVVHYPDGTSTDQPESINYKHPVYAKVKVTRDDKNNQFGLTLYKNYPNAYMGNGYDLKVGESLPNDATFDSWMTKSVGKLHQHVICSKKGKDGKYSDYTYNTLPGHVDSKVKNAKDIEKDGLRFKKQTIWGHATFNQQKSCIKDRNNCKPDDLLYDDWVPGGNSNNTSERTRGFFGGKAQKTGDYQCKVYAIRGDKKSDEFKKAVEAKLKSKKNEDPAPSVLNAKGNPYGTDGQGYKIDTFYVRIHNLNQLYNPTYTKIPEIQAGSTFDKNLNNHKADISSGAPQSKKKVTEGSTEVNANGVPDYDLQNVKEGALPKGTWYEIKRFVKARDITNSKATNLPWANFEDGEDNVKMKDGKPELKDGKKQQASADATGKGSVTFRPDKWQDADDYLAEVVVHYPDGSTSDGEGSINKDHPIYAKVKVTRPAIGNNDLHVNVYKYFDHSVYNSDTNNGQVDSTDNIANVDRKVGVTVMRGIGLLHDLGVDSWSTAKRDGITLRTLCRDANSKNQTQVWSENLDKLFFKLNGGDNQKVWGRANFQQQEKCRKGSNNGDGCDTDVLKNPLLFDSTANTMERSRGFISNSKAPTDTGKYYCAVFALKLKALGEYKAAMNYGTTISVPSGSDIVSAMKFKGTKGIDYAAKFFPVKVVEPFNLPKTGGEDCVNWNMLMSVVCVIGTGAMAAGFFLDQTKWGRAMLEVLLRKALIKVFIRKTAEWCGGVMLRIEWWITERWRC
ncbi:Rib/alpha-like domain-containing protein [Gardnerella piotii]|uniref:Rib/alpha-like domain-containing protein n=1 Tax=Gardnerella piotii TaxID=2792977 RepID=A0ABU5MPY9_9BIFI|nr:Rib/alpha-like domain-containing protein [Gardnerella piotii]MDZ7544487.1 Rib/alpha-like domain-containing protein [Gardnerella piotii]MDZ7552147.1 Rib/alpha-like domain-containing protein [Gardnerella piotii]